MAETMQRWTMDALGREHLQLTASAIPQPGPHEVRVKVKAVALNYRDKLVIETGMGLTLPQPFTPASDMAGEIDAIGAGVSRFLPGDRVISTFSPGWIDGRQKPYGDARTRPTAPWAASIRACWRNTWWCMKTGWRRRRTRWTRYRPAPCRAPG